jgi:tetratricopeptide (TPR) repeat protein
MTRYSKARPSVNKTLSITFITISLLLGVIGSHGQSPKEDSIKRVIDHRNGIEKFDAIVDLVKYYVNDHADINSGQKYMQEAKALAYQLGDTLRIVRSHRIFGQLYGRRSQANKMNAEIEGMLSVARRNGLLEEYFKMLNLKALYYHYRAKYNEALKINLEVLEFRERNNDYENCHTTLGNIALVYYKLGDNKKAIHYYNASRNCLERANLLKAGQLSAYRYAMALLLSNKAYSHIVLNQLTEAKMTIDSASQFCGGNCEHLPNIELAYGTYYVEMQDTLKGEEHFLASLSIARRFGDLRFQMESTQALARLYLKKNKFEIAEKYLVDCESVAQLDEGFNFELSTLYANFADLYERTNNLAKLVVYNQKFIKLNDSLFSADFRAGLLEAEALFQKKQNADIINEQTATIALEKRAINRKIWTNVLIASIAFLLLFIAFLIIRIVGQKKLVSEMLAKKISLRINELGSHQQDLQNLSREVDKQLLEIATSVNCYSDSIRVLAERISDKSIPSNAKNCTNEILTTLDEFPKILIESHTQSSQA